LFRLATCLVAWAGGVLPHSQAEPPPAQRIAQRTFPSVFQSWSDAEIPGVERDAARARHDLLWLSAGEYGLRWAGPCDGLAHALDAGSRADAMARRQALLARNPNLVLLADLPYRDAPDDWVPDDHPWWKRDDQGRRIVGWEERGFTCYLLDVDHPELRAQVAGQAGALVASGVVDGVMLDWFSHVDDSRRDLLRQVRDAVGPAGIIVVNSNEHRPVGAEPYVNGVYLETDPHHPQGVASGLRTASSTRWREIVTTIQWAEASLQPPRIVALETWFTQSRDEPWNVRMTTSAALTLSDGYALFGDPNFLPTPDHAHDWYDCWDVDLGRPIEPPQTEATSVSGGFVRRFSRGAAVFNPPYNNRAVEFRPERPLVRVSTGEVGTEFRVLVGDGDLFVAPPRPAPATP
jgi:hypothetical protein